MSNLFIGKLKQSQRIVTHRYRNGLPALDLLYIDDLVAVVTKAVGSGFSGNLNIGTGVIVSTQKIAEILRDLLGGGSEIDGILIDSDTAGITMDASRAQELLDWQPTISVEQGLQLIVSNLKN